MSLRNFRTWLEGLTPRRTIFWGLILGVVFEIITVILRFALGLESTRDTHALSRWTFAFRIHHGYLGLLFLGLAFGIRRPNWRKVLVIVGVGLVISDLAHHFLVLWPITGSPHFDIRYGD